MGGLDTSGQIAVPFLDLRPSHLPLREEMLADIAELLDSGAFTNGPQVAEFESAFADFCDAPFCVGVASGLDALRLTLQAVGLERGDQVVVPANTFIATAEAVTQAGGEPVFVDITNTDYNMDVGAVEGLLGARTRVLLPVHLYGQMSDMKGLAEIAQRHDLIIVEDACQAHGAQRDGLKAGSALAAAAAFSFYPGKNLGAIGDAGALVTTDESLAERVRALREHGQRAKYHHDWIGWTSRLDSIQAAALLRKLPVLDDWTEARRHAASAYLELLDGVGDLVLPPIASGSNPVWHLFVVRTKDPDSLANHLRMVGIGTGRHYPQPIHLSGAYSDRGLPEGRFPLTEALARECLSLPIFPGISDDQIGAVCDAVVDYFDRA